MKVFCKIGASTLLLLICIACGAQEQDVSSSKVARKSDTTDGAINNDNRANKMTSLSLKIAKSEVMVLQGTPIYIPLILANTGVTDINVHGVDSPSTFEYVLRSKDSKNTLVLSEQKVLLGRLGDPIPPLPTEFVALLPTQKLSYEEDISSFSQTVIAAGEYNLTASYVGPEGRIESPSIPLRVTPLNVQSVAMFSNTSPVNYLSSIYTHLDKNTQNISIFQRDSEPDEPQDGVSYFRSELAAGKLKGFATAIEMGNVHDSRWMAWLVDDLLSVLLAGRDKIYLNMDALKTELADPRLFPVGWQMNVSDGWATTITDVYFSLLGFDSNQNLTFSVIKINADSGQVSLYPVALGVSLQPERWKVKAVFAETGPLEFHLLLETRDDKGIHKIYFFTVEPITGKLATKISIPTGTAGIEALSMHPVSTHDKETVDILLDINQDHKEMKFNRYAVDGGKLQLTYTHSFYNPKDENNHLANNWVLPSLPLTPPVAVGILNDNILAKELTEEGRGTFVAKKQSNISLLNVELIGEQVWVIWFNSETGFMYQRIIESDD